MSDLNAERAVIPRARLRPVAKPPEVKRAELFEGLSTVEEMAEIFGVGWRSLYDWCGQGLPYYKVGNRRYFDMAKVRDWMEGREVDHKPVRPVGRPRKGQK